MPALSDSTAYHLRAPDRLVADTRLDFRRAALEHVERAAHAGQARVIIDLADTVEIDAAGLGVLVLFQKRAREKRLIGVLRGAPAKVRELLTVTRLDTLFEFEG